jgi:hypothetical protein
LLGARDQIAARVGAFGAKRRHEEREEREERERSPRAPRTPGVPFDCQRKRRTSEAGPAPGSGDGGTSSLSERCVNGGQLEPDRATLLLRLDAHLHAGLALSEVGAALGAQAGEARLREVVTLGGFTRVRRATKTPFNLVLEVRP